MGMAVFPAGRRLALFSPKRKLGGRARGKEGRWSALAFYWQTIIRGCATG